MTLSDSDTSHTDHTVTLTAQTGSQHEENITADARHHISEQQGADRLADRTPPHSRALDTIGTTAHTGAGRYRRSAAGRPETGLRRLLATSPQSVGSKRRGSGRQ